MGAQNANWTNGQTRAQRLSVMYVYSIVKIIGALILMPVMTL